MLSSHLLLASSGGVDLIAALRENDAFGIGCIIILVVLSVFSLTIVAHKLIVLKTARWHSGRFRSVVRKEGSWEALFQAAQRFRNSPLARLLKETYVECRLENWFDGKGKLSLEDRLSLSKATVEGVLLRTMSEEESRLQGQLWILATVSTLAPFIGLLGTVWGVLASFQSIGREGSAALTTLAPGISTALMTTVFGLFAAIPALLAYNYLMREVGLLSTDMESFSHEIENAVRREILGGGAA